MINIPFTYGTKSIVINNQLKIRDLCDENPQKSKDCLDNFKSLLFCFHTLGVRRSIAVLDLENQSGSGSGALGHSEDV